MNIDQSSSSTHEIESYQRGGIKVDTDIGSLDSNDDDGDHTPQEYPEEGNECSSMQSRCAGGSLTVKGLVGSGFYDNRRSFNTSSSLTRSKK